MYIDKYLYTLYVFIATGVYQCSSLTKSFLLKSSKMSFKPLVQNVGEMYHLYGKMPEIIKEGMYLALKEFELKRSCISIQCMNNHFEYKIQDMSH